MSHPHLRTGAAVALLTLAAVPLATAPAGAAANTGTVFVVHGVPGLPVDVYVNGDLTLRNFQPKTVTPPLALPAATYTIAIRPAGTPASAAPAISGSAALTAGANVSLVAHLSAAGTPTLTAFANEVGGLASGQARVIVRHTAAAPAVDVRAGGTPVVRGLTNPNSRALEVDGGTVPADVVLAGTSTVVLGPANLTLAAGSTTAVYAIGSASQDTLDLLTQPVTDAPAAVDAGSGGAADPGTGPGTPALLGALAAGGLLTGFAVRRLARR
jgi:hypothetical protein